MILLIDIDKILREIELYWREIKYYSRPYVSFLLTIHPSLALIISILAIGTLVLLYRAVLRRG